MPFQSQKSIFHLLPVNLEGNADPDLSHDGDQLQAGLAGAFAIVLLSGDLDDV